MFTKNDNIMLYEISMILYWTKQRQNTAMTDKFNRNSSLLPNQTTLR